MRPAFVGFGLGFLVASQIGPMALFLIRCTLREGWHVGVASGAGIAIIDGLFALAGAAGAAPLLSIRSLRLCLGIVGAIVVLVLGVRALRSAWQVRSGVRLEAVLGPRRAFAIALAGTSSNPLTIASWSAAFAAASTAGAARSPADAALLVVGVATGSFSSVTALASVVALLGRAFGNRIMSLIEALAGMGMIGLGVALGWRIVHAG